ncbi:BCS1 N terminal-domain-containing protein [Podospora aff. communis PSN243]|uniref:BCS1 N terminal-domain-containing protein n=1 Tax=Podospora aff. communis PSN243 TaxID=3040156 RepID=A0AAV9G9Y2_9PEZI|nr:BCS1 N terminal-domain-containing protein [Podospora aff. communis PSN243]
MNSLLTLAGTTSLLGSRPGTTSFEKLEERIPGFSVLQNFFKSWLGLDLTTVLTAAALMGAASSGAAAIRAWGSKVYWWIIQFLTASISIAGKDRLNREVLNWLGAHVLASKGTRILTANSETVQSDAYHYRRTSERNDYHHEKRVPVQYLPTFGATWFFFNRNLFMVRRVLTTSSHYRIAWGNQTPDEYSGAPQGDEPLVVMCLGRSVEPIKRFLESCRVFADKQRESFITVREAKGRGYGDDTWDVTILRPLRPLDTVHFDEKAKAELISDIENYLDPNTRKFYTARGIPYRRGYLFHGPPGTGKSSLSLALAGRFGLELYLVQIPTVSDDRLLERLFTALPPRCMVLLEDIDAVGLKRRPGKSDDSDEDDSDSDSDSDDNHRPNSRCTLAGLLNVLDGVASQEGRIVLMTSNFAQELDKALIRPGRVDRIIYLGHISRRSGELMFLRFYSREGNGPRPADKVAAIPDAKLRQLALEFSSAIPEAIFTPAQLQGYLLNHREGPVEAVAHIAKWVAQEKKILDDAKERARKMAERRKKKRREAKVRALAKMVNQSRGLNSDAELEALEQKIKREKTKKQARVQAQAQAGSDDNEEKVSQGVEEDEKASQNAINGSDDDQKAHHEIVKSASENIADASQNVLKGVFVTGPTMT